VIGWKPHDLYQSTLWEFASACHGWNRANGVKEKLEPPTDEEFYNAVANARI